MDEEEMEQMQQIASVYEDTENTSERMRVLCRLAETLDGDRINSLKSDAQHAYNYPSLTSTGRAEARAIIDRIEAVEQFRSELEDVHGL